MEVSFGKLIASDFIPTLLQVSCFILTYISDAGSSPTRIVAKVGIIPFSFKSDTDSKISFSDSFASFFPSSICAAISVFSHLKIIIPVKIDYLSLKL